MEASNYKKLVQRYIEKKCTDEELEVFIHLLKTGKLDNYLHESMNHEAGITASDELNYLRYKKKVIPLWIRISAAAIVILGLSIGLYSVIQINKPKQNTFTSNRHLNNDVAPGGNKAVLTLANGKKIILDNASNGKIILQGNATISKANNKQLVYTALNSRSSHTNISYNTITTPRGGQYQLILSDGSKVWLNSASSLRFPTVFNHRQRNVELTGEGYFEIAKNKNKPFHVYSNGQVVEVLGTHFNINAYTDENIIKTTLLEGSVKISYKQAVALIKPGEQTLITLASYKNKISVNNNVDVDEAIAWKNGYFQFNHADLQEVIRQLSRWYAISVRYEGKIPDAEFGGAIQKDLNLSQVLKILEKSQIHFTIQGKEVIVMP